MVWAAVAAAAVTVGTGIYASSQNKGNTGLSGTTAGQSTEQDPITQALNEYRLNQYRSIPGADSFLDATRRYGQLDEVTGGLAQYGAGLAEQRGLDPNSWYTDALANLNPGPQKDNLSAITGSNISNNYRTAGDISRLISELSQGNNDTISQRGNDNLSYINQVLAPKFLGSGQDYFRQILSPGISNDLSLMGLARSGGNQEAQAKGAASISQQISALIGQLSGNSLQQTQQLQGQNLFNAQNLQGQNLGTLSNQLQGNYLANLQGQQGFNTQYLQNLFGLGQAQPNVDTALRNSQLSRIGQGVQFSDYSRSVGAQQQNKALEQFLAMFTNAPYNAEPTRTSTENSGLLSGLSGQGLTSLAAGLSAAKSSGLFGSSDTNPVISATPYAGITATPTTSAPTGSFTAI